MIDVASPVEGLSHITFICKDIEKMANLLKVIFHAKEIYSSDQKNFSLSREKFFLIGGLWVAVMEGKDKPLSQTYNHIAFKVKEEDLPDLEEKIKKLGLTILSGRTRHANEGASLYFYDEDNHLFELHTGTLDARLRFYQKHPPMSG